MCCVVLLRSCSTKGSRAETRLQASFSKKEPILLSFAHDQAVSASQKVQLRLLFGRA